VNGRGALDVDRSGGAKRTESRMLAANSVTGKRGSNVSGEGKRGRERGGGGGEEEEEGW
jgi:hypothetical protein